MRYAIVEAGGKQYRAVEGEWLEIDRLAEDRGKQINLERVLLVADGSSIQIGTPALSGVEVRATILEHLSGPKVTRFRYSPKKRIRVRGGHRQLYTRLLVDFIGGKGEVRKTPKVEASQERSAPVKEPPRAETIRKTTAKKPAAKTTTAKKSSK